MLLFECGKGDVWIQRQRLTAIQMLSGPSVSFRRHALPYSELTVTTMAVQIGSSSLRDLRMGPLRSGL